MQKTGSCLCGAVKFEIDDVPDQVGACHCSMCRKWSGGVFMAITAAEDKLRFTAGEPAIYASSDWAERGFCARCGSSLFYRLKGPAPEYHVGIGTLEDASGITLTTEIFTDEKPGGYAFAGATQKMTGAELFAKYGA